ncbi:hypothetical protein RO3G_02373 [Rhizopus delemar RA 99-880]|uniref:Tc1-like transposase DDE domain-containing protein n=1 Tax=Rhizopus delemar (strain RA 99-880 / ATCC MYA-4621 / FGSC 9543 / NRRL 43880) TaxID=246409 RepID=I1BN89_RHIO9|nr:hypothetical protein RO3G_02373 [Rhizopus delemar RA 99-880]|eukprot:EIE77669.1 hypothetical protein RO3G_02373 [Rhizopus delemar RA 99-880]
MGINGILGASVETVFALCTYSYSLITKNLIETRGYKIIYLSPYSSFLNPFEEFCSMIKFGIYKDYHEESFLEQSKLYNYGTCDKEISIHEAKIHCFIISKGLEAYSE